MRDIRFRVWNIEYKLMEYDILDIRDALKCKFPIMQYTGLEDLNGKEIYEGDLVEIQYALNNSKAIGIIEMIDGCWSVSFRKFEDKPFCPTSETYRNQDYVKMFICNGNKINIIGNTHEGEIK